MIIEELSLIVRRYDYEENGLPKLYIGRNWKVVIRNGDWRWLLMVAKKWWSKVDFTHRVNKIYLLFHYY